MKRVLVTNADSILGQRLLRDLTAAGHVVQGVVAAEVSKAQLSAKLTHDRLEIVARSVCDANEVADLATTRADVIVQIANDAVQPDDYESCLEHVRITLRLIDALRDSLSHAIVCGGIDVQGDAERVQAGAELPTSYLDASLLACEQFWHLETLYSRKRVTRLRWAMSRANEDDVTCAVQAILAAIEAPFDGVVDCLASDARR